MELGVDKEAIVKFYSQYKLVIFPVLVAVSSLLVIILVVYPALSGLLSGQEKLSSIEQKSKNLEVKAAQLANIDQAELTSNLGVSLTALPTDQDYANAVGTVQSLALASGFNLVAVQVVPNLPGNFASKIPGFTLRAEMLGPRVTLYTILSALEASPRAMKVAGFEVNPSKTGEVINVVVNVAVFYAPRPSSLGSADAPLPEITSQDQAVISNLTKAATIINPNIGVTTGGTTQKGKSDPFN